MCILGQGRIQDFLIGGSNLQRGFDLLILPDYLLIFPDFKIFMKMNNFVSNPKITQQAESKAYLLLWIFLFYTQASLPLSDVTAGCILNLQGDCTYSVYLQPPEELIIAR